MNTTTLKPALEGVYSSSEAALYLRATFSGSPRFPRLHPQHLSWWSREGLGRSDDERAGTSKFINFMELVSFRLIATMRAYGIPKGDISLAHDLLRAKWGWKYPFAMQQMWVGAPDLFVEIDGAPVAVTCFWQSALGLLREFLVPVVNENYGLSFDSLQQACSWSPAAGVLMDPGLQFGEPCIAGTRIPTETIWAFHQAGDSIDLLARMYDLPVEQITAAIQWEEKLAQFAAD